MDTEMTTSQVADLQRQINAAGYHPALVVDGLRGPKTRAGEAWLARVSGDAAALLESSLAWGLKVSPEFRARVFRLCHNLGWPTATHADWLMACMAFETGRTFSPSVRNPSSSATGLIQFMAATARNLGTTTAALARMTAVEQLDWVERYFRPNAPRIASLESMYMAILWPSAIGRGPESVLWRRGTAQYRVNSGLDVNRNGVVTVGEAAGKVRAQLALGLRPENRWVA
jgi:hypothetical protein